jgi:CRISPR-associated endonuclease/helicase Cas3
MLIDDLWAKSSGVAGDGPPGVARDAGYPLLPHLLDVASVARELLEVVPCPVTLPCSASWVATLAGAHDLGKASPGFQAKLGASTGSSGAPDRHDASTVPLLTEQLVRRGLTRKQALTLANAVGAHHGSLIASTLVAEAGRWPFGPDWRDAHDQIMGGLVEGARAEGVPALPQAGDLAPFLRWLMGLTTVADWIGSSDALCDSVRLSAWCGDTMAWFDQSRALARKALAEIGLAVEPLPLRGTGADAMAIALDGWSPRPLQQVVANVIDDLGDDVGLLVIEAPMGEGKSEAGLGCARGRGLYLAMPTQATSNALYGRVAQFLSRVGKRPPPALAHGAGGPWAAQARLREIGLGTSDSSAQAGWWFKGSKRALLAADGIGTVDQALIGVLNARHNFVRLFGLAGRTVILDELHAYDSYTGGLIEHLCLWLKSLRCRVVLMSATLPGSRRDSILRSWAGSVPIPTTGYPRVTWARPGNVQSMAFPASREQRLKLRGIAAGEVAAEATKAAQDGARVLVIVNKVRRAQDLYQALGACCA